MSTQEKPLVSNIIIFLNAEPFIVEAIESIFSQSYDHWELLLADDGSSDGSTEIAKNYVQQYPGKVHYLEHAKHQNLGASATRNLAVTHAKGEYISFLDADDVWLADKLAVQVAIMQQHPEVALVYGRIQFWYSWTGKAEDSQRDFFMDLGVPANTVVMPPELLPMLWSHKIQAPCSFNTMIRRSVFDTIGGFEEKFRSGYEDTVFYTKIELNAPIFVSDAICTKYRQHENSWTAKIDRKVKLRNDKMFFNWAENYLIEQGKKDTQIWRSLQKTRLLYAFRRDFLKPAMAISRKILPISLRHYLWLTVGSRLYGSKINRKNL